ncbi:PREDICTED: DNA repair protein XRCC3 homolog [Fragaria vesca subsp. vesca]|uniref:DNA repair protein XRCC3 homolog n=1 Tax=Fragaria vesca subsp. vesca TaxID=101020 RepID=UPI0002C31162|nr:PREDICTED: DNA repair protein XRCC3 homolog [Fragaria vesca subsp. vesca]XP_011462328.1 PREDICTED: DNA repair protein XRCC3 homolog [Fragaria vesca subsp. vesca]XP_011462329.1 PREDICTED: DNA repair protein XRCC3 homolog [Fragaria vesca subsp. vesca]
MNPSKLLPTETLTLGCPILDGYLGGGIPCNSLTELIAESSCGKTQFCLQLTLFAQLPPSHGGLSASSLFLHSEFPFPFRRLRHLSGSFRSSHSDLIFTNPCDDVYVRPVNDARQLLDLMPKIETLVAGGKTRLPVRLIVIDSIAALFRSEFGNNPSDLKRRSFLFFKISGMLRRLASKYGVAVVVTNQVVDFMGEVEGINGVRVGNLRSLYSSGRRVCPALGLAWSNCVNSRLFLSRNEEIVGRENGEMSRHTKRRLDVVFAPHLPPSSCEFVITEYGVFGVDR